MVQPFIYASLTLRIPLRILRIPQMTYDLRNAEKALPAKVRKSIENRRGTLA